MLTVNAYGATSAAGPLVPSIRRPWLSRWQRAVRR